MDEILRLNSDDSDNWPQDYARRQRLLGILYRKLYMPDGQHLDYRPFVVSISRWGSFLPPRSS